MSLTVSFSKSAVLNCAIYESSRVKVSHEKYHAVRRTEDEFYARTLYVTEHTGGKD